jgi:serine/threonine protein kinase
MTKNIGTTFYIPPEAESHGKSYDTKFDIYSVGIVLFEMILKPPETRTERVVCLENLRKEMTFPSNFLEHIPEKQQNSAKTIVEWCLKQDPIERPSATQLLDCGLLPHITTDEDRFQKIIKQMAQDSKNRLRKTLFQELFNATLPVAGYDRKYCIVS